MRAILTLALWSVLLSGCGFHPMLAVQTGPSSVEGDLAKIKVGYIENRSGQVLRNDLIDALSPRGEPDQPEYALTVRIEEPQQNLAFQRNNSVTNVSYSIFARWALSDKNGTVIYSSSSSSSQQYPMSNSQYATGASALNARDRIAQDISQDIRNKLAQFFVARSAATAKK